MSARDTLGDSCRVLSYFDVFIRAVSLEYSFRLFNVLSCGYMRSNVSSSVNIRFIELLVINTVLS